MFLFDYSLALFQFYTTAVSRIIETTAEEYFYNESTIVHCYTLNSYIFNKSTIYC